MPKVLLIDQVDIFQCPVVDTAHLAEVGDELTSGDLHANAIKLLFLLVKHGIAKNMTESIYTRLVAIYKKAFDDPGLSEDDLFEFGDLLDSIEFNSEATLRLLGDILADRGGNDYLTLLVLHRLWVCGVKYEIILSNHDLEFLINYQNPDSNFSTTKILSKGPYCRSMLALGTLIEEGIERGVIDGMVKNAYLPALKFLSYTVNEQNTGITLFSHAPIGLPNIRHLAWVFHVACKMDSLPDLAHTIDAINDSFATYLAGGGEILHLVNQANYFDAKWDPVGHALWNRDTESLERPAKYRKYKIKYTHGHHGDEGVLFPGHIMNLDNNLGKAHYSVDRTLQHCNQGKYTLLHSGWKVVGHKSQLAEGTTCANLGGKRSPTDLGQWLLVDFPGIVMALDDPRDEVKHHFLDSLRKIGLDASKLLNPHQTKTQKNYEVAGCIALLCEGLIRGYERYLEDRNRLQFRAVCCQVFATLKPQFHNSVFSKRFASFVALAKAIDAMRIGFVAADIDSPAEARVSHKPAAFFAQTLVGKTAQSLLSLEPGIDSIPSSSLNWTNDRKKHS